MYFQSSPEESAQILHPILLLGAGHCSVGALHIAVDLIEIITLPCWKVYILMIFGNGIPEAVVTEITSHDEDNVRMDSFVSADDIMHCPERSHVIHLRGNVNRK